MNALLDQAKQHTADETVGGGDYEVFLHPEGPTLGRFVGYVEVGLRPQKPYQGQDKKPCAEARFTFELNGPKSMREITPEGEEPYKVPTLIRLKLKKLGGDRSSYVKLMRKMAYGRDIVNFTQMLDEPFLIAIMHGKGKDRDGNEKTYHNMRDAEGTFLIGAPTRVDPLTNETTMFAVPESVTPHSLLLWDNPTKEQWASIFIDGERTVKDKDGTERTETKNWLQRDIVSDAMNFGGSPIEAMLNGMQDLTMPTEDPMTVATEAKEDASETTADAIAEASLAADTAALDALTAKIAKAALEAPEEKAPDTADDAAKALAAAQAIFDKLSFAK